MLKSAEVTDLKVKVAKTAGFCFGVQRAVDTVYRLIEEGKSPIYTFGPIIHNEKVVSDLEEKGVGIIESVEDLAGLSEGTVVIRSHGVAEDVITAIRAQGLDVVDATCPFVKKIHNIVSEESRSGSVIVITGDPSHAEVEGIRGWCRGRDVYVINSPSEANALNVEKTRKICLVSQTTFNYMIFQEIVEIIRKKSYDIIVHNTICGATKERQMEARTLASSCDAMIVIGGRNSSNTQKLYNICYEECANTYYIQTLDDLELRQLELFKNVGITAGASTPKNIIEEVFKECQKR